MKISWRSTRLLAACLGVGLIAGCEAALESTDRSSSTGSFTLTWQPPSTNLDGTPLNDLIGYKIYYGQSSPLTPENSTVVDVGDDTVHTISDLAPGMYYIAMSATDAKGNESPLSAELTVEVKP